MIALHQKRMIYDVCEKVGFFCSDSFHFLELREWGGGALGKYITADDIVQPEQLADFHIELD